MNILKFILLAVLCRSFSYGFSMTTSPANTETLRSRNLHRIPWRPEGYDTWIYKCSNGESYEISYTAAGELGKPAILLCHGFGASLYHWRYNIPDLSQYYRVYAFDLLGFGQSSKPLIDYGAEVWSHQVASFITDVIKRPTVVAGNSLGGFTALAAASKYPAIISGCVLLNSAGMFDNSSNANVVLTREGAREPTLVDKILKTLAISLQRAAIGISFHYTKRPSRIRQVLKQVYSVNSDNVDDELVESIQQPSFHPNAAEVFYRIIVKNGFKPALSINSLLRDLSCPLLLLWGEHDPWIRPATADKIQSLYPKAHRVNLSAGHCPQDEVPELVNRELRLWMENIQPK